MTFVALLWLKVASLPITAAIWTAMTLSSQSIVVILLVGLIAGWLTGQIVRGAGFGLLTDMVIGIIGAFVGDWMLPRLGIHLGVGLVSLVIDATLGAIALLVVIRVFETFSGRGGSRFGWGNRWGRRW